eukprot:COSAG05_NODE_1887_length_3886_cov_6.005545_9_plen_62_part_00
MFLTRLDIKRQRSVAMLSRGFHSLSSSVRTSDCGVSWPASQAASRPSQVRPERSLPLAPFL